MSNELLIFTSSQVVCTGSGPNLCPMRTSAANPWESQDTQTHHVSYQTYSTFCRDNIAWTKRMSEVKCKSLNYNIFKGECDINIGSMTVKRMNFTRADRGQRRCGERLGETRMQPCFSLSCPICGHQQRHPSLHRARWMKSSRCATL